MYNIYNKIVTFYNKQMFKQMCYSHLIPNIVFIFIIIILLFDTHIYEETMYLCT